MTMLEIKKTHDGVLFARRVDGKQLTPSDREEAKRIAAAESLADPAADPVLAVGDDNAVAILIDSSKMRRRKRIQKSGDTEWDLDDKIVWYPGEKEFVSRLPARSRWTIAWAKRMRKPIDGRCFKVVPDPKVSTGYNFLRVKD